jgi:hypothetical protein
MQNQWVKEILNQFLSSKPFETTHSHFNIPLLSTSQVFCTSVLIFEVFSPYVYFPDITGLLMEYYETKLI